MAQITTRQTAGTGATVAGVPLTNAQIDQNFINLNTDLSNAVYLSSAQTISGIKSFTEDLIHNSSTNTKYLYISRNGGTVNEFTRIGRDDAVTHFYTKNDETTSSVRFTFENTDTEAGGGVGANTTFIELTGSTTPTISVNGQTVYHTGNIPTWNQSTTGNAASATILQTARNINGTSFNGSANITTASWGTSRTVTIGSTGKSVDGSSNVSWTLAEIGALGSSAKAADSELLDGQNSTDYLRVLTSGVQASLDTYTDNGIRNINYTGYSTHLLSWNIAGSPGTIQQEFDYNTAARGWRIRNKTDNTTWTAWGYVALTTANQGHITGTLLHSANYNTYSPTLTGTGASGTWSISITGNAATVTNGVYTTGSYADPAWITSLAKSKVGLSNVENTALSTWAGSTNITTVGAITSTSVTSSGGITTSSATHRVQLGTDAGGSISIGRIDNVTSFPYIDFNSGATSTDFDVRLASTGGNGTAGNGLLTITGNVNIAKNLTVVGTVQHAGLTMSAGTGIDQVYSVTDTLTLTTSWQDTTVNAAELATGTYVVQVRANDFAVGGGHYNTYYSGIMSWIAVDTNENSSDEIVLHRAGPVSNVGNLYLRVLRTPTADVADLKLQIAGSTTNTGTSTYEFKFRRLI